jgi:hypothetical protein
MLEGQLVVGDERARSLEARRRVPIKRIQQVQPE